MKIGRWDGIREVAKISTLGRYLEVTLMRGPHISSSTNPSNRYNSNQQDFQVHLIYSMSIGLSIIIKNMIESKVPEKIYIQALD
jgi:hypothetical protein